jgi:hypothetical protein
MTPSQIDEVKRSFVLIAPIADQAGISFYKRLFEIDRVVGTDSYDHEVPFTRLLQDALVR